MPRELRKTAMDAIEMLKGNENLTIVSFTFEKTHVSKREDHIELAQMVSREINALTMFEVTGVNQLEVLIIRN
ncbi:hypothetical protein [Turicibacter sanguinis]|uniref:hypothetical protein n=1 Tax=Turicibacter sanguinis TaxID=154288 RepID=UPI00399AEB48